jgi:hypothetical protein
MLTTPGKDAGERSNRSKSTKCIESHIVSARQSQYHLISTRMRLNSDSSNRQAYVARNNLRVISDQPPRTEPDVPFCVRVCRHGTRICVLKLVELTLTSDLTTG